MVDVPSRTRPRLFLIDGYAFIYRAFFAMISRPLTTSRGENTSAAFGFTRFLMKLRADFEPDYLGVVLDSGNSARTALYPEYKATREKMPDELRASLPRIRELLEAFRIPILELPDTEADDVIGTLATRAAADGLEAVIVSGDKDFYQLIGEGVALLNPGRGGASVVEEEWVDLRNASERLGVPPELVTDYLALIGDSSDNVPGAKGIGPKTALKLIEDWGGINGILENLAGIKQKRARESLEAAAEAVRMSHELVTIRTDLPIELNLADLAISDPDNERLHRILVDLEFHTLARELGEAGAKPTPPKIDLRTLDTVHAIPGLVQEILAAGGVSLMVESTEPVALRGQPAGIGLALRDYAYYLPLRHRTPGVLDLDGVQVRNLPPLTDRAMAPLRAVLEDPDLPKTGHNLKNDVLALSTVGVELAGLAFDTQVASYVLDPGQRDHSLDTLAAQRLGHRTSTREDVTGKGREEQPFADCPVEQAREYVAGAAAAALRLRRSLGEEMENLALDRLFHDIEMPLIPVLATMERTGIRIDVPFFTAMGERFAKELDLIQQDIWKIAGEEFNISSTQQLRTILFDKLDLPVVRKTKTGPSTDASVLEELAGLGHDLPMRILEYRQIDKLKGTYVDALPHQVDPATGRIHTSLSQTVAATGRLSSNNPNLQNIPIRTDQGAEIRKGFVPDAGNVFLSADYSQIELRILAHFSGDPAFVEAFRNRRDIHRQTAAIMFGVPVDEVTAQMRAAAKTVNFATIYGIGPFALSQQLGTPVAEAKEFIANYFTRFPGVREYLDTQVEHARTHGYVETLSGRRRYIPEIKSRNYNMRQFGERAATNAPVQGSAADIIKIAMIRIHDELVSAGTGVRMLLQVHDELVFEIPEDRLDATRAHVRELMEGAFRLDVPLEVETGVGHNWFECK